MNHTTIKPIKVYRGDFIESTHDVHIVVVKANGDLISYYGDPYRLTFARSSMKPIQAIPVIETGAMEEYEFSEKELALFCASHSGESFHRKSVKDVLNKMNIREEYLQCGTHIPKDMSSYNDLIKNGGNLTSIYSNCSGKHSGMLAGCLMQNIDINTYRDLSSPYQQQIINLISDVCDYDKDKIKTSIDGCGVPVHLLPLYHFALGFARLAKPKDWHIGSEMRKNSLIRIRDAMMKHPEMVAGTGRFDTDLMTIYDKRIVAKGGAEGVHCFGDKQTGIGVAVKVEDGNGRGTSVAVMEVLKQLKIGDQSKRKQLEKYLHAPIFNARNKKIGEIKPSFKLNTI